MAESRSAILGRISQALGHVAAADAPAVMQRVNESARGPQPQWAEAPRERFLAKLTKVAGTYAEIASPADIVQAVSDYLAAKNLPHRLVVAPHPLLAKVIWPEGWDVASRRAQGDDRISLAVDAGGRLVRLSDKAPLGSPPSGRVARRSRRWIPCSAQPRGRQRFSFLAYSNIVCGKLFGRLQSRRAGQPDERCDEECGEPGKLMKEPLSHFRSEVIRQHPCPGYSHYVDQKSYRHRQGQQRCFRRPPMT